MSPLKEEWSSRPLRGPSEKKQQRFATMKRRDIRDDLAGRALERRDASLSVNQNAANSRASMTEPPTDSTSCRAVTLATARRTTLPRRATLRRSARLPAASVFARQPGQRHGPVRPPTALPRKQGERAFLRFLVGSPHGPQAGLRSRLRARLSHGANNPAPRRSCISRSLHPSTSTGWFSRRVPGSGSGRAGARRSGHRDMWLGQRRRRHLRSPFRHRRRRRCERS